MKSKIKKRRELGKIVQQLKKEGNKIVTTNGTFDLLHYGHIKLFEYAKKQGDILVVGMNSDKSVKMYKNPNRPIVKQKYRAEVIEAIQHIDYVTIFNEIDSIKFVKSIKPDIHVNSAQYGYDCIEREIVEKYGGKIKLFDVIRGHSTSELIKKIIKTQK